LGIFEGEEMDFVPLSRWIHTLLRCRAAWHFQTTRSLAKMKRGDVWVDASSSGKNITTFLKKNP
jgi:hypothetical protein